MKKTKQKMKKERGIRSIALSQIIILVVATVAFAWMIGSEVKVVSASAESEANCYAQRFCVDGKIYPGHLINPDLPSETCVANNMIPALETCSSGQCNGNECFYDFNKPHNFIIYLGTGIALGDFLLRAYNTINKAGIGSKVGTLAGSFGPYPVPPKTPGFLGKTFGGTNLFGQILYSAAAAFGTRMLIMAIVKAFGTSEENMQGLQTSTLIGAGLGTLFGTLAAHYGWFAAAPVLGGALIAAGIVIVAALTYLLVGYKLYSREIFTFRTMLWQPPVGGSDCNKCNLLKVGTGDNQVSGCSEYICHSYGAACDWVNGDKPGGYETCVWKNTNDHASPGIKPIKEAYGTQVFPNNNYNYKLNQQGAAIIYTGGGSANPQQCLPAFSSVMLAVNTSEAAQCRIIYGETASGTTPADKFTKMQPMTEGTVYTINHTLLLPPITTASSTALNEAGYELTNGGVYKFYIRCQDVQGNINPSDYVLSFCVQEGPDFTPPEIIGTSPVENNDFIPYGIDKITGFQVYTNEPATCRWDVQRKPYEQMINSFDRCSKTINEPIAGFDLGCIGNLTHLNSAQTNRYYIACNDTAGNKGDPYELVLIGTNRLLIQNVRINGGGNETTIESADELTPVELTVMTSGGAENGNARCSYTETPENINSYSLFENDKSTDYLNPNTDTLYIPEGDYTFFLRCEDVAGNFANTMITFSVDIDDSAPNVVRVYKDEGLNALMVITDEPAECVYSNSDSSCGYPFEEGSPMSDSYDGLEHTVDWNPNADFYIKCRDEFGKMPYTGCSIEARPFEIFEYQ